MMDLQGKLEIAALSAAFCAVVSLDLWGLIRYVLDQSPAVKPIMKGNITLYYTVRLLQFEIKNNL